LLAVLMVTGWTAAASAAPILSLTSGTGGNPVADSVHGWEFVVNRPITVTNLGLFDNNDDGFAIQHDIGLFRLSDSTLLTSGTISAGTVDTLLDGFRYIDVADVTLDLGESYAISYYSLTLAPDQILTNAVGLVVDSSISIIANKFQTNAGGLIIPGSTTLSDRFGPNFLYQSASVPTSGTIALFGLGLVALRLTRRKKV